MLFFTYRGFIGRREEKEDNWVEFIAGNCIELLLGFLIILSGER
jgi:hypothetical protein